MTPHASDRPPVGEDDLLAYVDGRLDPRRRGEVESHLAQRPEDAVRVALYRSHNIGLHALADGLEGGRAPDPRLDGLALEFGRALGRQRRFRQVAVAFAASFALVLAAAGGWRVYEGLAPPPSVAALDYALKEGVVLTDDRPTAMAERTSAGDGPGRTPPALSVRAPDLRAAGFTLVDVRAAFSNVRFVYENKRGAEIVLRVASANDADLAPPEDDDPTLLWRSGALVYRMDGTADGRGLLEAFRAMREAAEAVKGEKAAGVVAPAPERAVAMGGPEAADGPAVAPADRAWRRVAPATAHGGRGAAGL